MVKAALALKPCCVADVMGLERWCGACDHRTGPLATMAGWGKADAGIILRSMIELGMFCGEMMD